MGIYRLAFANNEVVSCTELSDAYELNGPFQYGHLKGRLIYAIVQAGNANEAEDIGNRIAKEVERRAILTDNK